MKRRDFLKGLALVPVAIAVPSLLAKSKDLVIGTDFANRPDESVITSFTWGGYFSVGDVITIGDETAVITEIQNGGILHVSPKGAI